MEDKNFIEINKNDFIYIYKKKKPRVGIVIEENNELKCISVYLDKNENLISEGKVFAKLKKYDLDDLEVISREKAIRILKDEE
ncbi:hypothetical protein [Clostridium sp. M14]|uniref:hypothetical protein n=1 Tax=Clostridium sp. M14 TaxID=2716311 RepID=UPI0013EEB82C|nr:hypothetical protein [Clostridium sp. M14]MBZ9693310.1 hypothetical protein [Clostridium sp. M14]